MARGPFAEAIAWFRDGGASSAIMRLLARLRGAGRSVPSHESSAFTSAFIALAAKMAKADGVALLAEREAFERFLETPASEIENVRRLYDLAKQDTAGYETYALRIGTLLRDESDLKRNVLECLIYIACADGVLHPEEDTFLATVADRFGLTPLEYRHVRALFVRDSESPYEMLGVAPDAPDAVIKKEYRKLVYENHPDRLAASGAQPAIVKAATAKLAAINTAYEAILRERSARGRA